MRRTTVVAAPAALAAETPRVLGETPGFLPALWVALAARPDIPRHIMLATARATRIAPPYVSAVDIIRAALAGAERTV